MADPVEQLKVWNLAMKLVVQVYKVTGHFPAEERFGLSQQLRRAAVAIPANIAEGNARNYPREYVQYCHIARGSIAEVKCLLRISLNLGFLTEDEFRVLFAAYDQLGRMLQALINQLAKRLTRHSVNRKPDQSPVPSPAVSLSQRQGASCVRRAG